MAQAALVTESKLTDRFQTTVPSSVRQALRLEKKDKIKYTIQENGSVLMSRLSLTEEDPVLDSFLSFLARDMQKNPSGLQSITESMRNITGNLVESVNIDLDAQLSEEDE